MDEIGAVADYRPANGGSLHLWHEVHRDHCIDTQHQKADDQHDDGHDRGDIAERLPHGRPGASGGWSIQHEIGVPGYVQFHSGRGGQL